jgi:hypothetical protein
MKFLCHPADMPRWWFYLSAAIVGSITGIIFQFIIISLFL